MATLLQRRKKLRVGGIWHDSQDNKVRITKLTKKRVHFKILELPDHQPKRLPDGAIRIMPMEDREECIGLEAFIAKGTGFDCMSEYGTPQQKNF